MGPADPDNGLRDGDAESDPDRAAEGGNQDGGEDTGGERDGDSEGAASSLWWGDDDPDYRYVHLAHRNPDGSTTTHDYPIVRHPNPWRDMSTGLEGLDARLDADWKQWKQRRDEYIADALAARTEEKGNEDA